MVLQLYLMLLQFVFFFQVTPLGVGMQKLNYDFLYGFEGMKRTNKILPKSCQQFVRNMFVGIVSHILS